MSASLQEVFPPPPVMVAGELAAPGQELEQLGLQQLQLARHQEGHDGGGLVEVSQPHVLQPEVHQLRHAGVQGEDGGLGDQGGVDVDTQAGGGVVPGGWWTGRL